MYIKTFDNELEANAFIDTVKPLSVSYEDGGIIVIYNTIPTVAEMKAKKIRDDEAEALVGLAEAEMQLIYLNTVKDQSDEDAKIVKNSLESCEQNIKNYKAKLKAIEIWKSAL